MSNHPARQNAENDPEILNAYWQGCRSAATRLGFAQPGEPVARVAEDRRLLAVDVRTRATCELVTDLQQWLVDDSATVRASARAGLRQVMQRLYTGDRDERAETRTRTRRADRLMAHFFVSAPDGPERWWQRRSAQRRLRVLLVCLSFVSALATATSLALGLPLVALALLGVAGVLDVAEAPSHVWWVCATLDYGGHLASPATPATS